MIKFEYKPRAPDADWGITFDPPAVESLSMTLGDDVTWNEAVCEFKNFLRAAGYVIPYDFEEEEHERAMRMSGPDKWWHQSNTESEETDRLREKKKQIYEDLKDA